MFLYRPLGRERDGLRKRDVSVGPEDRVSVRTVAVSKRTTSLVGHKTRRLALVVSHADLEGEHFLVNSNGSRLVGVIDWSDVCLADPALDIGSLAIWLGPSFVSKVAEEYAPTDRDELCERGLFLARTGLLIGLGQRLGGENDWPLDLLRRQIRVAFAT